MATFPKFHSCLKLQYSVAQSRLHSTFHGENHYSNNGYLSNPQTHWSDLPYSISQHEEKCEIRDEKKGNRQPNSFVSQQYHNERDIPSLQQWAKEDGGIQVAEGVILVQEKDSLDCSAKLERPVGAGTAIVSVPGQAVLSSSSTNLSEDDITECRKNLSRLNGMDQYLPEFLLMVHLLDEISKGPSGFWYPYLNALPSVFSTGLWMDELERDYLEMLAPDFVKHQNQQFEAFMNTLNLFSTPFDDTLVLWAFSVVFTRSWRTPNEEKAVIVPIGDMFNHDSRMANAYVLMTEDRVQIILKESAVRGQTLYLDYGISERPERFLVMYGFFDHSCGQFFLDIPFDEEVMNIADGMGFTDFKTVTIDSHDGKLSKAAWDAVLYKVLLKNSVGDEAKMLQEFIEIGNVRIQSELHDKWKMKTAQWVSSYAEEIIDKYSIPDLWNGVDGISFRHQQNFCYYCAFMHSIWQRVRQNVQHMIRSEKLRSL